MKFKLALITCLIINTPKVFSREFSTDYKELIKEVKKEIEDNCKKNLPEMEFTWMHYQLEQMLPNEIARFNQGRIPWIEFSSKFRGLPTNLKRINIFHEIGHVFGLEHKDGIMNSDIFKTKENFKDFYKDLCPRI